MYPSFRLSIAVGRIGTVILREGRDELVNLYSRVVLGMGNH